MKDPYAQDKAELIAAKLFEQPDLSLSQPIEYRGKLDGVLQTVRLLQHRCGFPETKYQVKFNGDINVLRLSDYFTRHACEPGEFFWLWGTVILGGDIAEQQAHWTIARWARGIDPEPAEDSMPAQAYAIVKALNKLREERNVVTQPDQG
jgi:hypothetical protein